MKKSQMRAFDSKRSRQSRWKRVITDAVAQPLTLLFTALTAPVEAYRQVRDENEARRRRRELALVEKDLRMANELALRHLESSLAMIHAMADTYVRGEYQSEAEAQAALRALFAALRSVGGQRRTAMDLEEPFLHPSAARGEHERMVVDER